MLWHALVSLIWLMTYSLSNIHCTKDHLEDLYKNKPINNNLAKVSDFDDIIELVNKVTHKHSFTEPSPVTHNKREKEVKSALISTTKVPRDTTHKNIQRHLDDVQSNREPQGIKRCKDLLTKVSEYENLKTKLHQLTTAFKRKCNGERFDDFVDKLVQGCLDSLESPQGNFPAARHRVPSNKNVMKDSRFGKIHYGTELGSVSTKPYTIGLYKTNSNSVQNLPPGSLNYLISEKISEPIRRFKYIPVDRLQIQKKRIPTIVKRNYYKKVHNKKHNPRTPHSLEDLNNDRSLLRRGRHHNYHRLRDKRDTANFHAGRKSKVKLKRFPSAKSKHSKIRVSRKCCTDTEEEFLKDAAKVLVYLQELEEYLLNKTQTNVNGKLPPAVPKALVASQVKSHRHCNSKDDIIAAHQKLLNKIRDLNNTINNLPHHESNANVLIDACPPIPHEQEVTLLIPATDAPPPDNILFKPVTLSEPEEVNYDRIERDLVGMSDYDYDYAYDDYYNEYSLHSVSQIGPSSRKAKDVGTTKSTKNLRGIWTALLKLSMRFRELPILDIVCQMVDLNLAKYFLHNHRNLGNNYHS